MSQLLNLRSQSLTFKKSVISGYRLWTRKNPDNRSIIFSYMSKNESDGDYLSCRLTDDSFLEKIEEKIMNLLIDL